MSNPIQTINGIKDSFSSWDKCMAKSYCKWPVIIAIVIGSLIALTVIYCVARCVCCGAKCACCCFKCCCGGGSKRHKYLDPPPRPVPAPGAALPVFNQYQSAPQPVYQHNPYSQTATFESKVHEDALPAMPSWETAASKRVEVIEEVAQKEETHELEKLDPNAQASTPALTGFAAPKPTRPGQLSMPQSPYHETDSFLRSQSPAVLGHADSHSGYRGAAPDPASIGYGYARRSPGPAFQSAQNIGTLPDYQSNTNFNNHTGQSGGYGTDGGRNYDQRPDYSRQPSNGWAPQRNSPPRGPITPVYPATTAYEPKPQSYQPSYPSYGGQAPAQGPPQRAPGNGSWKDV